VFTQKNDDTSFTGILMGTGRDLLRFLVDETLAGFPLQILTELEGAVTAKKHTNPLARLHALIGKFVTEIRIGCLEHLRIVRAFFGLLSTMVSKMVDLILPRRRPAAVTAASSVTASNAVMAKPAATAASDATASPAATAVPAQPQRRSSKSWRQA
jgi:hypothetical protein